MRSYVIQVTIAGGLVLVPQGSYSSPCSSHEHTHTLSCGHFFFSYCPSSLTYDILEPLVVGLFFPAVAKSTKAAEQISLSLLKHS